MLFNKIDYYVNKQYKLIITLHHATPYHTTIEMERKVRLIVMEMRVSPVHFDVQRVTLFKTM